VQDEMNHEKTCKIEQDEVDGTKKEADFTGKVMHTTKSGW